MKKALFYDTETTGLPLWNDPSEDERQPHLVQLGASLVDLEARRIMATIDLIIRPNGWVIPDEIADLHGISQAQAEAWGVSERLALTLFDDLWSQADVRIGHNEQFDARIIRIGLKRYDDLGIDPDAWKAGDAICTATLATPICDLPPTEAMLRAGRRNPKRPSLREAFEHLTGRKMEDAHSALADCDACMSVYFAIKDREAAAA